jgi:hypothetical protein
MGLGFTTDTVGTSQTRLYVNVDVYLPSLPAASNRMFQVFPAAGSLGAIWFNQATGKAAVSFAVGGTKTDGPPMVANTWYNIQVLYDVSANPHTLDWWVDGVKQTQITTATTASTLVGMELMDTALTQVMTCRFDNLVLDSSTTAITNVPRQYKVAILKVDPAGTVVLSGTAANWNTFTGATPTKTAWNVTTARDAVDEVPPNLTSAQDGFCQITLSTTDYVEVPMTSYALAPGETIAAVRALACGWQETTSSATIGLRSFNGTTETTLLAAQAHTVLGNNTSTPGWICKMCTLADFDTQAELDALTLRVGFSGDATPAIGVQALYAEVLINLAPGPYPALYVPRWGS